jgi:microcystin-dependent protein
MDEELLGSIKMFAGTFAPHGYALCEGQTLQINQYQALFSILGTNYGGDGQHTFTLPDLRPKAQQPSYRLQNTEVKRAHEGDPGVFGWVNDGTVIALQTDQRDWGNTVRYIICIENGIYPSRD